MSKHVLTLLLVPLLVLTLVACQPTPPLTPALTSAPPTAATLPGAAAPTPTPIPSFSGRVTDAATGQGVAGAKVEAWNYLTITGPDGSYAMFDLPAGDYRVRVTAPDYAREYWDNVTSSSEASLVAVSAGVTTQDIDFVLNQGGSISGHVYQSDGITPVAGADVSVRPGKYRFDEGFSTTTNSDGSYTVGNLPLGNFRVTASAEGFVSIVNYYKDKYGWDQASDVAVIPPGETSGIDIRLDLAGSISGFVYASDGVTPIPNVLVGADDQTGRFNDGFGSVSNSDGSYTITGILPGLYTVRIEADLSSWYAGELYDSKYTFGTADRVVVSAGNNTPNINFNLHEGGSITGHVFDEDTGEPLHIIELFACLPDGDCVSPLGRTTYDGSYKFVLRPGKYLIKAGMEAVNLLGGSYVSEWYDNAYDINDATLVSVALHQETSGIDFYLASAGSISGHVYEADGTTPIPSASVYAFPVTGSHPGNGANTGPDGSYTIAGLPSGIYRVQATVSGHVAQYYDNAPDEAAATGVRVNAPDDTPGIDFALSRISE